MVKPINTVASVVLTFFVTLVLNTALNYYASDKGTISIGKPVQLGGKLFSALTVENYTKDFIDGLSIEIPSSTPLSEIVSDTPASVADGVVSPIAKTKIIKIGQVSPRAVTRIYIPVIDGSAAALVRIANADSAGLTVRRDDELASPLRRATYSALVVAAIYAVFAFGIGYYTNRKIKTLEETVDRLQDRTTSTNKRISEIEARVTKQRLLLQARLFDYSKELEFWRNAFRELVLNGGGRPEDADSVIKRVTSELRTHGTSFQPHHFEAVRVAAAWLAEAERQEKPAAP